MNTTRLTILAVVLSAFVVERTFAQGVETVDVLAVPRGPAPEAPTGFDGAEEIDEGLGPLYNAQACRECHPSPISGARS